MCASEGQPWLQREVGRSRDVFALLVPFLNFLIKFVIHFPLPDEEEWMGGPRHTKLGVLSQGAPQIGKMCHHSVSYCHPISLIRYTVHFNQIVTYALGQRRCRKIWVLQWFGLGREAAPHGGKQEGGDSTEVEDRSASIWKQIHQLL